MLFAVPGVLAADASDGGVILSEVTDGYIVTPITDEGVNVLPTDYDGQEVYESVARYTVTYELDDNAVVGSNYVILLHNGDTVSVDSIGYIDQVTITQEDLDNKSISFKVYPYSIDDAMIKMTSDVEGFSSPETIVEISVYYEENAYILGDVDEDGYVTVLDSAEILKAIVGSVELSSSQILAADVDISGTVTVLDSTSILQYVVLGYNFG